MAHGNESRPYDPGTYGGELPPELTRTRAWLHELFSEASRGLPWPYQLAFSVIEQGIVLGMFGGLLASALALQDLRDHAQFGVPRLPELARVLAALESAAIVPMPEPVRVALQLLEHPQMPIQKVEETITVLLTPFFPSPVTARGR